MTDTQIVEHNRAIAEFMGLSFDAQKKDGLPFYIETNKDGWISKSYCNPRYHSDWNQMMAVGKKIYDLLADRLKQRPPHTATEGDMIEVDIHCAIREYNIVKAHEHIYRFVCWYNTQNSKQHG